MHDLREWSPWSLTEVEARVALQIDECNYGGVAPSEIGGRIGGVGTSKEGLLTLN